MHRTTVKLSAPNPSDLQLCHELAENPRFTWIDNIDLMIEFTFEFEPSFYNGKNLTELTMEQIDIIKLEEDPRFAHINIEAINEYPEAK